MKSRRMKFFSVLVLALVFCASLSMGIAAMAADEAKPDTGLEYYVQCVASGSQSGGYKTEALPVATDVPGLELPANQSATSRAFDVPTAEGNGEIASADTSGRHWGLYYGSMNMWGYYAQAAAGGDGAWYETCEPGSIYGSAVWSANDKIVYKFELPDSTTEYDVVVGANNTPLGNHWDAGFNQCASAVFINGEDTPSAVTGITNTNQNVVVKGVTAEATDADTGLNNILTITIDKPTGEYIPDGIETVGNAVVSFIMITRSDATQPLVLDTSNAAVMSTVKGTAEQLPATVEVLTTQGMKAAGVTYTDLTQFNDAANRFMLNDITVKGKLFGVYDCDIPLMFIPSGDTYYYADSGARWVDGSMPAKAFEAMDPILNPAADKIFDQTSDGSTWGRTFGGDPGGEPWPINPSPYFSHVASAQDPNNDNVNKVEYLFPDLEAGNYLVYVSVVTAYNGGTANVSMVENDQQIGTFDVAFKTDSWAALVTKTVGVGMMEKKGDDPVSVSITCQDAGFYVGFVLITEASNDVGGDDVDQAYFLLAGNNTTNIPVDGIGLPANQTVGVRNFNDPNGGAARADLSGKYWGLYYTEGMPQNYYETYSDGENTEAIFRTVYAAGGALDDPDTEDSRQMIFKFELDPSKTYDVVVGITGIASWGNDNSDGRAGYIFINHAADPAASFGSHTGLKAIHLAGVTSESEDPDTGIANILTIAVKRVRQGSNPMVAFISVRETGKTPVFLSSCASVIGVETTDSDLPTEPTVQVLTTAGKKDAVVTQYTDRAAYDGDTSKQVAEFVKIRGDILYGEKTISNQPIQVSYIIKDDVYYYANLTLIDETGVMHTAASAELTFEAMRAANPNMLNTERDATSVDGSWGCTTFANNIEVYWGYNESPYVSVKSVGGAGEKHLTYNFPDLPEGDYLVHIGMNELWGVRNNNVAAYTGDDPNELNYTQLGTFTSVVGQNNFASYLLRQDYDGCDVELDIYGTDGPLVGFIIIRAIDIEEDAQSVTIQSYPYTYYYNLNDVLDLRGLMINVDTGLYQFSTNVTEDMVTGFDSSTEGEKTITINFMGKQLSYKVMVLADEPSQLDPGGDTPVEQTVPLGAVIGASCGAAVLAAAAVVVSIVIRRRRGI